MAAAELPKPCLRADWQFQAQLRQSVEVQPGPVHMRRVRTVWELNVHSKQLLVPCTLEAAADQQSKTIARPLQGRGASSLQGSDCALQSLQCSAIQ